MSRSARLIVFKKELNWLDSFTQIYTSPYPGGADDADHQMFRLKYARVASHPSGRLAETPNLEGVSGASVWALTNRAEGLWTPEKVLKVVAIQASFKHGDYIGPSGGRL